MRSETLILIKIHKIEQYYFDVSWTFWLIQTENALVLSVQKIPSQLLVMRGKSHFLLSVSITSISETVILEQLFLGIE